MRVVTLRGRVSFWDHCVKGSVDFFEGGSEDIMYLFFSLFIRYIDSCTWGLVTIYRHTLYLFSLLYCWCMLFFHLPISCVVSFLSLYTCFLLICMQSIILFHTKMSWWALFKVFQKYRLSKSTCHKLSSCKVFQEFVLG